MDMAPAPKRLLGSFVGAGVPAALAGLSVWLALPITGIAGYGVPIGAFVGFVMARRVVEAKYAWMPAIESSVVAVLVAIAGYIALGMLTTGSPPFIYLLILPYVFFFAFLLGMPVALPVALVSAALLRGIVRSGRVAARDRRIGSRPTRMQ